MSATSGHPGVWGDGMEPEKVRNACDKWLAKQPAPEPRPIVPARAYRPRIAR